MADDEIDLSVDPSEMEGSPLMVIPLFAFDANGDDELSFKKGQRLTVRAVRGIPQLEWLWGTVVGAEDKSGFVPAPYLHILSSSASKGGASTVYDETIFAKNMYYGRYTMEPGESHPDVTQPVSVVRGYDTQTEKDVYLKFMTKQSRFAFEVEMHETIADVHVEGVDGPSRLAAMIASHPHPRNGELNCIVLERPSTTLDNVYKLRGLTTAEATYITWEILMALGELHRAGYMHGHVTLEAIGRYGNTWKIGFFNYSMKMGEVVSQFTHRRDLYNPKVAVVAVSVAAKTLMMELKASHDGDIWQFGLLLYELLTCKRLLANSMETLQFLSTTEKLDLSALPHGRERSLLETLLDIQAFPRLTVEEVLERPPYFVDGALDFKIPRSFDGEKRGLFLSLMQATVLAQGALYHHTVSFTKLVVPHLFFILPTTPSKADWQTPAEWTTATFSLYFICEWDEWHPSTNEPALAVKEPKRMIPILAPVFLRVMAIIYAYFALDTRHPIVQFVQDKGVDFHEFFSIFPRLLEHRNNIVYEYTGPMSMQVSEIKDTLYDVVDFLEANDRAKTYGGLKKVGAGDGRSKFYCEAHGAEHAQVCVEQVSAAARIEALEDPEEAEAKDDGLNAGEKKEAPRRPARDSINARARRLREAARLLKEEAEKRADNQRMLDLAAGELMRKRVDSGARRSVENPITGSGTNRVSSFKKTVSVLESWMWKLGGPDKNKWEKRFCLLSDDHMVYYKTLEGAKDLSEAPAGCIHLGGSRVETTTALLGNGVDLPKTGNSIVVHTDEKDYWIRFDEEASFTSWLEEMQAASLFAADLTLPCPYRTLKQSPLSRLGADLKMGFRRMSGGDKVKDATLYNRQESPTLDGVLLKLAKNMSAWQPRWFALQGKSLFYFLGAQDVDVAGMIPIAADCRLAPFSDPIQPYTLCLMERTGCTVLATQTEVDYYRWKQVFTEVIESLIAQGSGGVASAIDPSLQLTGYLWKQGIVESMYSKRFFVLKAGRLYHYSTHGEMTDAKEIDLRGTLTVAADASLPEDTADKHFFLIKGNKKKPYLLAALSDALRKEWIAILNTNNSLI